MTDNLYASGSATSAGIDYQQRVAAWFLVALLFNHDISNTLDLPETSYIKDIAFETAENIDDLRLQLTNQNKIYLQIKRSLNLSTSINSDFYKTIKQFVKQFVLNKYSKDIFTLITSSDSSSKILRDLVKILSSARLNDERYTQNPLSKSEHDTYEKYLQVARGVFKEQTSKEMTPKEFTEFSKKIFIVPFDIEEGKTLQKSVLVYLLDKTLISPELFWGLLIKNALIYSSKRLSLNRQGLNEAVKKYLKGSETSQIDLAGLDTPAFASLLAEPGNSLPSGKEVLLIKSFADAFDYMIVELFRFDDDGSKKIEFFDNKCLLSDKTTVWTVFHRTATYAGMTRFISENISLFQASKGLVEIRANDIEEVESSPHAQTYSELCRSLLNKNKTPLTCLHCGKAIRETDNLMVEIDDNGLEHSVGTVHKSCLRPIDRVLGILKSWFSEKYDFLRDFDGITWSKAIIEGQSLFNDKIFAFGDYYGWDPEYQNNEEGNNCIKVNLEDGSYRYIKQRGKVLRFTEQRAREDAEFFNNSFEAAREKSDPFCYTSLKDTFGPYSTLVSKKDGNEACLECLSAEPVRYSNLIGKAHNNGRNFYAPLCLLVHSETSEWITINSHVVLLTDPLLLMDFIENWKKANIQIDEYMIQIIENDEEFDSKMREFSKAQLNVIVDPLVNRQKEFIKGIPIMNYQKLIHDLSARHASSEQENDHLQDLIDIPEGLTFGYEFQGQVLKIRILRAVNNMPPPIGQEEYFTLPGSTEALFMADGIRSTFPAILVDEELDALSILQVAEDIIAPTATGGMQTARQELWIGLLRKASIVLISFPNNDAGREASQWWITHLPNAKIWPLPREYRKINEMLLMKFDLRGWILSGLTKSLESRGVS